jgi:integrase
MPAEHGADWVEVGRCHVGEALSLEISRLVGHSGTTVTELVYRHQLKPVIQTGATVMDELFGRKSEGA